MLNDNELRLLLKDIRELEELRKNLPDGPKRDIIERDQISILQALEGVESHQNLLKILLEQSPPGPE